AVVCEVGMGGRLDSTNVLDLGVAAITNVALDHTEHLGATVEAIAREKAAIIKPGDTAVTAAHGVALEIVRERCREAGAVLAAVDPALLGAEDRGRDGLAVHVSFDSERMTVRAPLLGLHQAGNVVTAVAVCDALRARGFAVDAAAVRRGCETVRWPGRMQWIDGSPPLLLDAAHNPAGMTALASALRTLASDRTRVVAVFAAMRDKDAAGMARALQSAGDIAVVTTTPDVQRAAPAQELAGHFTPPARAEPRVRDALLRARELAGADGLVLVCGSLYLVGEVLQQLGV
ncbi:MAG: bifunctional folylpolyglutamate synthase/dihydrofolate synthase, partial [Candidatus Dormibacteraeota bacterium]|nr:bifunctional folylpolyglutamate synthase/dihydrofolate synthase [Candidatus Dormibacteraeota bacterium]